MAGLAMRLIGLIALSVVAGSTAASDARDSVSPIEKVLTMLQELQEKVVHEGRSEAKTYDKFACFCKDTSEDKTYDIEDGQAEVDDLVAKINALTSDRNAADGMMEELNKEIASINKEMAVANKESLEKKKEYEAKRKETTDAMTGIINAEDMMSKGAKGGAALLTTRKEVAKKVQSLLQDASHLGVDHLEYEDSLASLLQLNKKGVEDPEIVNYAEHEAMEAELGTLKNLENDFTSQRDKLDIDEVNRVASVTSFLQDRFDQLKLKEKRLAEQKELKGKKAAGISQAQNELTEAQSTLHDDQAYIRDLTEKCNEKSAEWDQRTNMRTAELAAVTQAIDIIGKRVAAAAKGAGKGMKRLLQVSAVADDGEQGDAAEAAEDADDDETSGSTGTRSVSFLQLGSPREHTSLLSRVVSRDPHEEGIEAAMELLRQRGQELKSPMLIKLASEAGADPFKKIKQLISELIGRLSQEAADEASHKGWCDKELDKATVMRDDKALKIDQLNSMLDQHEAKKAKLEDAIGALTTQIDELDTAKSTLEKQRADEKAENENTVSQAEEGKAAIEDAIKVLKEFYGAAKEGGEAPAALVQSEQDPPDAGFSGDYKGSQSTAGGIMGMMEVILGDFTRTIEITGEEEAQALREFTDLSRSMEISIETKSGDKSSKEGELSETTATIDSEMTDLKREQEQLDKAITELIELHPACIDTGMSYEERVAKREQEVESLNQALCLLDKEGPVKGDMQTC